MTFTTATDSDGRLPNTTTQRIGDMTYSTTTSSDGRTRTQICTSAGCD